MNARRVPKPKLVAQVGPGASVLEASAGTGKTFTLEHLVLDLLLEDGLRIEEILVVTFGEKAARELRERVRERLRTLLAEDAGADAPEDEPHWVLNEEARLRLDQALMDFDRAPISTIHAFCHRLLTENALLSGRPFKTETVSGQKVFARALRDCLRGGWAVEGAAERDLLRRALDGLGGEEELLRLLWAAAQDPGTRYPDAALLASATERFATASERATLTPAFVAMGLKATSYGTVLTALEELRTPALAGDWGAFQTRWDDVNVRTMGWEAFLRLAEPGAEVTEATPPAELAAGALLDLLDAAPTLHSEAVDTFLPQVLGRARALKEEGALLDFDDMLDLAAEALRGPHGALLAERLGARYRAALIDEFQDTSQSQWDIFRTLFQQPNFRLVVIGDPKQAIFGFRGGDIYAYEAAKRELLRGGEPLYLDQNFRSTPAMIRAYNAILDQGATPPFFEGPVAYDHPVESGNPHLRWEDKDGQPLPAIQLVQVPRSVLGLAAPTCRARVAEGLARAVARLLASEPRWVDPSRGGSPQTLRAQDIFVLTSTGKELLLMARKLREVGVPTAFYKRDGLFQSSEALDLLNLLKAIAQPHDADLRAKAWITPVFGATLGELANARELPEDHPALLELQGWHRLARERKYPELFRRVVDHGLLRHLIQREGDDRAASKWLQLVEYALMETGAGHVGFDAFVQDFQDLVEERVAPSGNDGNAHRVETDQSAVQLLTMHKSKGLDAKVVVLFGGLGTPGRKDEVVHRFFLSARRHWVGKRPTLRVKRLARLEMDYEGQRLMYVALTRAKGRMILPWFDGSGDEKLSGNGNFDTTTGDPKGAYRYVNRRLRQLQDEPSTAVDFQVVALGDLEPTAPLPPAETAPADVLDFTEPKALHLAAERSRPARTHSYSSLSRELHEHGRPDPEEQAAPTPREALPGGTATGTCLHAILEQVSLATIPETLEAWLADEGVSDIIHKAMTRAALEPRHREEVGRLVHRALTHRYELPGGATLPGLAPLTHVLREMDFLMPHPAGLDLLDGSIDLLFEWEGKTYFLDWKSSQVGPDYSAESCRAVMLRDYELQFRIYALSTCAFLKIQDERDYEARFGGGLYVFLRGLPDGGVTTWRPSWADLEAWRAELLPAGAPHGHP